MRREEVYLLSFGKKYNSEFGKIRPALIIQNDIANRVSTGSLSKASPSSP